MFLLDSGRDEKSSFLVFRIGLGRGLSRVVAAAVVDAMEETTIRLTSFLAARSCE
jgi:hypothetical protein